MPGRQFNSNQYRYGFNGQEKDDEVKGDKNSVDFEARIYDSRLGRWLSVDPDLSLLPSISPYNFVLNSPNLFCDPNGKYSKVTIQENSDGTGTIIISSIIYVKGEAVTPLIDNLNSDASNLLKGGVFIDDSGKKYNIKIELNFKDGNTDPNLKIENEENIVNISNEEFRSHTHGGAVIHKRQTKPYDSDEVLTETTSYFSDIKNEADVSKNPKNSLILHEVLHLVGFSDRYHDYKGVSYPNKGYSDDIMADSDKMNFDKSHYSLIGKYIVNKFKNDGIKEYINTKTVDVDQNSGKLIVPDDKKD